MPQPEDLPWTHLHLTGYMGEVWDTALDALNYLKHNKMYRRYLLRKIAVSRGTWFPLSYLTHPSFHHYMKLGSIDNDEAFVLKIEESIAYEQSQL